MLQHITYTEWLPLVVGSRIVESHNYGLTPFRDSARCGEYEAKQQQQQYDRSGFFLGYDSRVDPHIFNEFATAAMRFGHTLVGDVVRGTPGGQARPLDESFFRAHRLLFERDAIASLARAAAGDRADAADARLVDSIRNKLFRFNDTLGLDLFALNVQRGRDHGRECPCV